MCLLWGPLADGAGGRDKATGATVESIGAVSRSVARTRVGEFATDETCACLLKMALLSLWLHQGCTVSYLDPTKALPSVNGAKLLLLRGSTCRGSHSTILLMSS